MSRDGKAGDEPAYELLHLEVEDRVAVLTIDAPPINVMTVALLVELGHAGALAEDDEVSVILLRSADPDFFAQALGDPEARRRMEAFLDGGGRQTRDVELRVAEAVAGLGPPAG